MLSGWQRRAECNSTYVSYSQLEPNVYFFFGTQRLESYQDDVKTASGSSMIRNNTDVVPRGNR